VRAHAAIARAHALRHAHRSTPRRAAGKVCVVWESPTLQVITTVFYVYI
jgi:hypothetical protein